MSCEKFKSIEYVYTFLFVIYLPLAFANFVFNVVQPEYLGFAWIAAMLLYLIVHSLMGWRK